MRDDRVDDATGKKASPTPADVATARRPANGTATAGTTRAAAETETPAVPAVVPPGPAPRPRVVIAEDEALIRLDLSETLQELGYDVVGVASDGERAIALAEELRPDVVILDVKMPVLDGISAARRIAGGRIAPVVILTAFSQRDLVERARDAGAMAYLVKPFGSADLMPAIEMALSRFAEVTALELEVSNLTERLETRKLVDRAKSVLQETQGLSEPAAFRWIQRAAMDQRVSMRAVAEALLTAPGAPIEP